MKSKAILAGLASATLLTVLMPAAATANPFGNIMNSVNEVNDTVNEVNDTVNTVEQVVHTFDSLSSVLGLDTSISSSISDADPTGQVMELYGMWFASQQLSDQENIGWLITEYAANQNMSLETIADSDWFSQKTTAEQTQVADTFSKITSLLEASDQDSSRFLGYASCINAGAASCAI
ncbi:MAG: hypothetical protein ACFB16_16340 [Phormidesmis sp.]